jgi:glycerophosphoryl diester phosphodiesterase
MRAPTIIAHRGASREAPENTLAAFTRALALGADGIELDVHQTADGAVVVHHDPVPRPPDGETSLAWKPLSAMTAEEVRRLRIAGDNAIPTLQEVLELVGDRATIYCELKGVGVVEVAAPILARHPGPCAMHSFDHRAVRRASQLAPRIPRGILISSRLVETRHAMKAAKANTLWAQRDYVDASLVTEVHESGGTVIVWTANDPLDITRLASMGADGICSDDVVLARTASLSTLLQPRA